MIHIANSTCANTAEFLDRAVAVAEYYGFTPIEEAQRTGGRVQSARIDTNKIQFARKDERVLLPLARSYANYELNESRQPQFVWQMRNPNKSASEDCAVFDLHIVGIPSAVAEATLLSVSNAIADEVGVGERVIALNSIGSEDSAARFAREVGVFLRKHIDDLSPTLRTRAAIDPIGVLVQLIEKGSPLVTRAPQSMEFLNEEERQHFWSVLEYLEVASMYYELNPLILGSRDCWNHTLFELRSINRENSEMTSFARGGRYDALLRRSANSNAVAAGISIACEVRGKRTLPRRAAQSRRAAIYFAHLGLEAKRRSIPLLESLRRASIAVHQSLAHEHIAEQMEDAKRLGVPYILIMGHKEAMEGTVLVRDMNNNSQIAVALPELPTYLKRQRIS